MSKQLGLNVKTVKEQTFHKRSTNVPTSSKNETKTSEFVPETAPSKEHISIQSRTADSGPNRNNLPQQDEFGNDTKTFWYRLQNDCPFVFDIAREDSL